MKPQLTIITPTRRRPIDVLRRCIGSVKRQTFTDWQHWVCSDGEVEPAVESLLGSENEAAGLAKFVYHATGQVMGHFGAGVRAHLLPLISTPYMCHLDDDNILFPRYAAVLIDALKHDAEAAFAVGAIIHHGPLPVHHGPAPQILTGNPVKLLNIDTLQVLVKVSAMRKVGWTLSDYCSDGITFERLAAEFPCVFVEEVLAAHL